MFSDVQIRTIKCDGPECDKTATFDLKDVKAIQAIEWLKGVRVCQTGDNRAYSYCSDVCEVKGITTGQHNLLEKPKAPEVPAIIPTATATDVKQAAAEAEAQTQITEDLKSGNKEIVISQS